MDMLSTLKGSLLENFYPEGWDLNKIDLCCSNPPDAITEPQSGWNRGFRPVPCGDLGEFNAFMGHEIALSIKDAKDAGRKIAFVLPVGPMGMYKWAVYFLKQWNVDCSHVYGFNMDEWSDAAGNTLPPSHPGAFQNAMESAFYGPLGELTVPEGQRFFAVKDVLASYSDRIKELKAGGAELVVVFGIGRVFHIAFWEPHFASEFKDEAQWKAQAFRTGAKLHPLTVEQNAITSFKSRTTLVPCYANTIGPGVFLEADRIIGGCDGTLARGMMWQGMSLWTTLRYGPDIWVPSSYMPTLPGKLFFLEELAGPLEPECN